MIVEPENQVFFVMLQRGRAQWLSSNILVKYTLALFSKVELRSMGETHRGKDFLHTSVQISLSILDLLSSAMYKDEEIQALKGLLIQKAFEITLNLYFQK